MVLVSHRANLIHQISIGNFLIFVSSKLSNELSNVDIGELGVVSTSSSLDDLLEGVWINFAVISDITLLKQSQEHCFFLLHVDLLIKLFEHLVLVVDSVEESTAEVGEHVLDLNHFDLVLKLVI